MAKCMMVLIVLIVILSIFQTFERTSAGKRRVHITDDLDDVIDDEEDEEWKQWGAKKKPSLPDLDPSDLQNMDPTRLQAEMMKRQSGPAFGFVKLKFGVKQTPDMVAELAMKWTRVLRTGAVEVRFTSFDTSTVMFSLPSGVDTEELREFILSQPEAYEVKLGDQAYRRPGDPPLEEVLDKLRKEKNKEDDSNADLKEEL